VAINGRKIYQGDDLSIDVKGGCIHRTADEDGYLVKDRSGYEMFIPHSLEVVETKAQQLVLLKTEENDDDNKG